MLLHRPNVAIVASWEKGMSRELAGQVELRVIRRVPVSA
jgi:hypothetical protein